jgi:hypothetical protein
MGSSGSVCPEFRIGAWNAQEEDEEEREKRKEKKPETTRGDERIGKSDNGKLLTADLTRLPSKVEEEQEQRGCWIMMNRADACTQQEAGETEKETDTRERGKEEGSQPARPVECISGRNHTGCD